MPDLGKDFVGSLWNSAGFDRALPISTWAGQNLDTRWFDTLVTRDDATSARATTQRSHKEMAPLYRAKTVMVQEDQAEGLGLLY